MANFNFTEHANEIASPPVLNDPSQVDGNSRVRYLTGTSPTGFAQNEVATIYRPKKGEKWDPTSLLHCPASGAGVTVAVGIAGATSKFVAATAIDTEQTITLNASGGWGYEFDGETDVIATFAGGNPTDAVAYKCLMKTFAKFAG